ncbi:MAG: hypothetical protein LOD89_07775 [Tissierellales bacterium]
MSRLQGDDKKKGCLSGVSHPSKNFNGKPITSLDILSALKIPLLLSMGWDVPTEELVKRGLEIHYHDYGGIIRMGDHIRTGDITGKQVAVGKHITQNLTENYLNRFDDYTKEFIQKLKEVEMNEEDRNKLLHMTETVVQQVNNPNSNRSVIESLLLGMDAFIKPTELVDAYEKWKSFVMGLFG